MQRFPPFPTVSILEIDRFCFPILKTFPATLPFRVKHCHTLCSCASELTLHHGNLEHCLAAFTGTSVLRAGKTVLCVTATLTNQKYSQSSQVWLRRYCTEESYTILSRVTHALNKWAKHCPFLRKLSTHLTHFQRVKTHTTVLAYDRGAAIDFHRLNCMIEMARR